MEEWNDVALRHEWEYQDASFLHFLGDGGGGDGDGDGGGGGGGHGGCH